MAAHCKTSWLVEGDATEQAAFLSFEVTGLERGEEAVVGVFPPADFIPLYLVIEGGDSAAIYIDGIHLGGQRAEVQNHPYPFLGRSLLPSPVGFAGVIAEPRAVLLSDRVEIKLRASMFGALRTASAVMLAGVTAHTCQVSEELTKHLLTAPVTGRKNHLS